MKVVLGKICSPFGLKGEFECFLYSNSQPSWEFARLDQLQDVAKLIKYPHRSKKDRCLCSIQAILKTPEDVKSFVGKEIWLYRNELSEIASDEVYLCDVIGLPVVSDSEIVGHVVSTHDFGAGIVLEVSESKEEIDKQNQKIEEEINCSNLINNKSDEQEKKLKQKHEINNLDILNLKVRETSLQESNLKTEAVAKKIDTRKKVDKINKQKKPETIFIHWNEIKFEENRLLIKKY